MKRLINLIDNLSGIGGWLAGILMAVALAISVAEIVVRSGFDATLYVTDEYTGYLMAMLTFMGLGAITGALVMPKLRSRMGANAITLAASILLAIAMAGLSQAVAFAAAAAALFVAGLAWIAMMASLNGGAQATSPGWVKARALAIYLLVFQGSMAAGSTLWGSVASAIGVPSLPRK